MEVLHILERLFEEHAPETLMALFGAGTSLLLFYLIGAVLRQWFGFQNRNAEQEADQGQATATLIESLVAALVMEASHLRTAMDGILREMLRRDEQHAEDLADLLTVSRQNPSDVVQLLKPEFDHLHQALGQTETRIIAKLAETVPSPELEPGEGKPEWAESNDLESDHPSWSSEQQGPGADSTP